MKLWNDVVLEQVILMTTGSTDKSPLLWFWTQEIMFINLLCPALKRMVHHCQILWAEEVVQLTSYKLA